MNIAKHSFILLQLADKEREMFQLCAKRDSPISAAIFPGIKPNEVINYLIQQGVHAEENDRRRRDDNDYLGGFNNSSEKFIEAIKGPILFGIDVNGKDTEGNKFLHLLCKNN